jgi:hypothetical protein
MIWVFLFFVPAGWRTDKRHQFRRGKQVFVVVVVVSALEGRVVFSWAHGLVEVQLMVAELGHLRRFARLEQQRIFFEKLFGSVFPELGYCSGLIARSLLVDFLQRHPHFFERFLLVGFDVREIEYFDWIWNAVAEIDRPLLFFVLDLHFVAFDDDLS